ncbi:MAG: putative membrane protein YkoI [Alteromonadaceae bacterium]|jgi:uncharacterized membrane protein YkoI
MMKFLVVILCICYVITLSNHSYAYAVSAFANGAESHTQQTKRLIVSSSGQAAQLVKSSIGGKVLKVQSKKINGRAGYKVKIIKTDGHIISVLVDAESGRIIGR